MAGCEGDIASAVGMVWLKTLIQGACAIWMANPARVEIATNTVVIAHCTVPRCLLSNYQITTHFESGKALSIQGDLHTGPVTLVRLGGWDLRKMWVAEGYARPYQPQDVHLSECMCRTKVQITLDAPYRAADLLTNPLGNHLLLVFGNHAQLLKQWHDDYISEQR